MSQYDVLVKSYQGKLISILVYGLIVNAMGVNELYEVTTDANCTYVPCRSFEVQAVPLDIGTGLDDYNGRKAVSGEDILACWSAVF